MKKITQEYVEGVKDHNGLTVIKAPVVSEGVANWYEENKEGLEENIWKYIYYFDEHMQDIEDFPVFISNCLEKPLETLVSMQYGYYVQKEKKQMILKCVEQFEMAEIDENGNDTGEAFRVQEGTLWEVPREEYEALGFRDFIEELNEVDENGGFKGPFIMFVGVEEVKGCFEIFEEEVK